MYDCGCYDPCSFGYGHAPTQVAGVAHAPTQRPATGFTIIVVLFILLVIIGASYCK